MCPVHGGPPENYGGCVSTIKVGLVIIKTKAKKVENDNCKSLSVSNLGHGVFSPLFLTTTFLGC